MTGLATYRHMGSMSNATTTTTTREDRIAATLAARAERNAQHVAAENLVSGQTISTPVAIPGNPYFPAGSVGIVDATFPNPAGPGTAVRVALDYGRVRVFAVAPGAPVRLV